jgi:hypothetical protein
MEYLVLILAILGVGFGLEYASRGDVASWTAGDSDSDDSDGWQSMFNDGLAPGSVDMLDMSDPTNTDDIYYSPIYSHLSCNVYHDPSDDDISIDDDDWSTSSMSDDDWSSASVFDDDSSTSMFDDDTFSSTSMFDDSICGNGIGIDDSFGCGMDWDD